jgi:D-sedoheptulose 7-phosphate isomerase
MNSKAELHLQKLIYTHPSLESCRDEIRNAFLLIAECYHHKGKVLVCGNGGSAADAEHIVGELMKTFALKRPIPPRDAAKIASAAGDDADFLSLHLQQAVPAISLVSQMSLITAVANDISADMIFAQQVYGYGRKGDVLIGISTSGNSSNILKAVKVAKAFDLKTIGLIGESGGAMKQLCDLSICVPARETFRIQEFHQPIYHCICAMVEEELFGAESDAAHQAPVAVRQPSMPA